MILVRARRITAAVLAAVALSIGTAALVAPTAQASTSITFCFRWSTGAPYANQPVYLYAPYSSNYIKAGKTAANGCAGWATPTNGGVRVRAYVALRNGPGYQVWNGWTPYVTPAGAGGANLGTGIVSQWG